MSQPKILLTVRALFSVRDAGPACGTAELVAGWRATQFSVEPVMLRFSQGTRVRIGQECLLLRGSGALSKQSRARTRADRGAGGAGGKQVSLDQRETTRAGAGGAGHRAAGVIWWPRRGRRGSNWSARMGC